VFQNPSTVNETVVADPPRVDGYSLVARYQIPIRRVAIVGFLTAPIWIAFFFGIGKILGGPTRFALHVTLIGALIAIVNLTLVMPIVHEVIHGVVARLCGARPTFGIGAGFAYTTFTEPVRPVPYLVIGLAPLVVISVAGLWLLSAWSAAPGQTLIFVVGNACGAFGDIWVALKVLRLPKGSLICDLGDGFAHYLPANVRPSVTNVQLPDQID
jgi:hypothetical protein